MSTDPPISSELAQSLAAAFGSGRLIPDPPAAQLPTSAEQAWALQLRVINLCGDSPGGWKVGAKTLDGPIQGCPLPSRRIRGSGTRLYRSFFARVALELEIAFRFGQTFTPDMAPLSDTAVMAAVAEMAAAFEIVGSRYANWPQVDRLAQLADLQNHGALVVGDFVPYRPDFPFVEPELEFRYGGQVINAGPHRNPAGDPRRLLPWLVNHSLSLGVAVTPTTVVTTGTYTGFYTPASGGVANGAFRDLPALELLLE
ncbi:MAG: hypothetical protein JNJ60_14710 [Rhodocyclaceae bacterium]|nr:hypothetical protein [Rhodocyclaceae bacterium]